MGNFPSFWFFLTFVKIRPSPPMYEFVSREKSTYVWQRQHSMNVLELEMGRETICYQPDAYANVVCVF